MTVVARPHFVYRRVFFLFILYRKLNKTLGNPKIRQNFPKFWGLVGNTSIALIDWATSCDLEAIEGNIIEPLLPN